MCRLFERILCSELLGHLSLNHLISTNQHGFLPRRSTVTQLLDVTNQWMENYIAKKSTCAVYTDLAKAFDKVSHVKLLEVLKAYGIDGNVSRWIKNVLYNRYQRVVIRDSISTQLKVLSGVPQGSVIGPLLFLIYIDDITSVCSNESSIYLFADDAKVFSTSPDDLQLTVNNISSFFKSRQLLVANDKCEKITFSKDNLIPEFTIDNHPLKEVDSVKDLGIFISNDLKWHLHINKIKSKAFQRARHILKSFHTNNIWTLLKVFESFVRPIVEYGSQVWNPYLQKDIEAIESVQRFYTKKICCRANIPFRSYEDRLFKLNMRSLQYRRLEADVILTFKIVHQLVDIPTHRFFEFNNSPYNTRQHSQSFKLHHATSNFQRNFFANRISPIWNKLPSKIVLSTSLNTFVSRLKSFDLRKIATLLF